MRTMRTMFIISLLFAALSVTLAAPFEQHEAQQISLEVTAYSAASCSSNTEVASISFVWNAVSRFRDSTNTRDAKCAKFDHELPDGCTLILRVIVGRSREIRFPHRGPISAGTSISVPGTGGTFQKMSMKCKPVRIELFYFRGITVDLIHDSNVVHHQHSALTTPLDNRYVEDLRSNLEFSTIVPAGFEKPGSLKTYPARDGISLTLNKKKS
ncbi:hypothetical protein F5876DRAFT_73741 [Lentinula aff. lateritia]|uniref:Uncharacterized protein n=1 Tax=Lentinula aff. lateritia TaxID=2804960 RepID=A0ACC1U9C8_9AGAR|nr:hypothetical protein F5876DRAFT_73741 [Lentinula aff. lateritia]